MSSHRNSAIHNATYRDRLRERNIEPPKAKTCSSCSQTKMASDFYRSSGSPDGLQSYCKACMKTRDRDRKIVGKTPRPPRTPEQRSRYFEQTYGITLAQRDAMIERQGGVCGSCGKKPPRWVVDHDHDTGKVRGMLCDTCNRAIGMLGDTVDGVTAALAYLMSSEDVLSRAGG